MPVRLFTKSRPAARAVPSAISRRTQSRSGMELPVAEGYWVARFVFQRGLAGIYLVAFLVAARQFRPLAGEDGLLPLSERLERASFRDRPSLFRLVPDDRAIGAAAWTGVALPAVALVAGPYWLPDAFATPASMALWAALWLLYLSFVNAGRGRHLLRLRLGVAAAGDRLPGRLSRRGERRPAPRRRLAAEVGAVPERVRRRSHQAARRRLLAPAYLSELPLRFYVIYLEIPEKGTSYTLIDGRDLYTHLYIQKRVESSRGSDCFIAPRLVAVAVAVSVHRQS